VNLYTEASIVFVAFLVAEITLWSTLHFSDRQNSGSAMEFTVHAINAKAKTKWRMVMGGWMGYKDTG
jgi:hypothetical protein